MSAAEVAVEVETVKCDCCGLTEDCTPEYIARERERHAGRWICGLCAEAVKEEIRRSGRRPITAEEALSRHMSFSESFRSRSPPSHSELITAIGQLIIRGLDSPRGPRSTPGTPRRNGDVGAAGGGGGGGTRRHSLTRSESCMPSLAG